MTTTEALNRYRISLGEVVYCSGRFTDHCMSRVIRHVLTRYRHVRKRYRHVRKRYTQSLGHRRAAECGICCRHGNHGLVLRAVVRSVVWFPPEREIR